MKKHHLGLERLHSRIRKCHRCFPRRDNVPVPGEGRPRTRGLFLIGQAPGLREPVAQRMFAWTAGKRLFQWLGTIGLAEESVRTRAYIAAVTKCYPGRAPKGGGDRKPAPWEVANCAPYLDEALRVLKPRVVVTIGGLALERILGIRELTGCVGREFKARLPGGPAVVIPLPHPSGASTWFVQKANQARLRRALSLLKRRARGSL